MTNENPPVIYVLNGLVLTEPNPEAVAYISVERVRKQIEETKEYQKVSSIRAISDAMIGVMEHLIKDA